MCRTMICVPIVALALCSCRANKDSGRSTAGADAVRVKVTSAAFIDGAMIPAKHTCDGANVSPPIAWTDIPAAAKSIALICDDPDAPGKTWVHWVAYDLPATVKGLPENVAPQNNIAGGGKQGENDFRQIGYGGPCPPSGTHRHYFRVYALDAETGLAAGATRTQLERAMKGHVLAEGKLLGRYGR